VVILGMEVFMKELIIKALNNCMDKIPTPPTTKPKDIEFEIDGGNIVGLTSQISEIAEKNNVDINDIYVYPSDDGLMCYYTIQVDKTEKEVQDWIEKQFNRKAFKQVYDVLISEGYKRIGACSSLYKEFDNTTVYNMFTNKEFDRLVSYYSLAFKK
jgi:hypothetical protein